jgi:hypothetical protein
MSELRKFWILECFGFHIFGLGMLTLFAGEAAFSLLLKLCSDKSAYSWLTYLLCI